MLILNEVPFNIRVHISRPNFAGNKSTHNFKWDHHLYIYFEGESIIDQFHNRRNRPYQVYKKEVIPTVLNYMEQHYPEVFEVVKNTKWHWSQKCGCKLCPCTPGFHGQTNTIPYHVSVSLSESK